jgi:SAM-dependent MidA family methyltransferase
MNLPPIKTQEEAPPQPLGDFKPVDEWQTHLNAVFYGLRGSRIRDYYQTMASGDYRLAHALAQEFYEAHANRKELAATLLIHEWGCGNGNLAACFLSHLQVLDTAGSLYKRVQYVLVDNNRETLRDALSHPDLKAHRAQVSCLQADVQDLSVIKDNSIHWIIGNELWSDLPTKVMLRKDGEIVEEQMRPNLSAAKTTQFQDWFGFVKDFGAKDVAKLQALPSFLEDIIWEKDYQPVDWKRVPYRKTITEFLKPIEDLVLVPVNLGAFATIKEAKRVLQPGGRFISFDAGTPDPAIIGDPDKPCYSLLGGQYSFMVNFALCEAVARQLGIKNIVIEPQKEFVSRELGQNVLTFVELLNTYPFPGKLKRWERDRLTLQVLHAFSAVYRSPYQRSLEFPIPPDIPEPERSKMVGLMHDLPATAVPDTAAYLTEEEILAALPSLEELGFSKDEIRDVLTPPSVLSTDIDYYRFTLVI